MIGKLKGIVDHIAKDHLILDVNGVGYIVFCSNITFNKIKSIGELITLLIEMHVREDHISLYGFAEEEERFWFKSLITVKGVGAKLALNILSNLSPINIAKAININDKTTFKHVNGVGLKLAERILTELKDKAHDHLLNTQQTTTFANSDDENITEDAISALTNLGYQRLEAYNIVQKMLLQNPKISLGELLKISLKELA
jgi:Holliday junction DNA helicase RuvA